MKEKITFGKILKTIFAGDQELLLHMNYFELEENIKKLIYKNGLPEVYVVYDRASKVFYGLASNLVFTEEDVKLDSNVVVENIEIREYDAETKKNLAKAFHRFKINHPDIYGTSFDLETMNEMIQKNLKIATLTERKKLEELCTLEAVYHERFSKDYEHDANMLFQSRQFNLFGDIECYALLGMNLANLKRKLPQYQVSCYYSEEENSIYLTDQNQIKEFGVDKISLEDSENEKYVVCPYLENAIRPIDQLITKDERGIHHANEDDIIYFYRQLENFKLNHPEVYEKSEKQKKLIG